MARQGMFPVCLVAVVAFGGAIGDQGADAQEAHHIPQVKQDVGITDDAPAGRGEVETSTELDSQLSFGISASSGILSEPADPIHAVLDELLDFIYMIPASAHTEGAEGTSWISDAVLYNDGDGAATVKLWFLKNEQDNLGGQPTPLTLPGRTATRLVDFVLTVFGEDHTSGALLVASDKELVIGSRTYNNDATGTFGQYIPGIPSVNAIGSGEEARLIQLTRNSGFRTNIGFANATDQPLYVSVDLRRANGNPISQRYFAVQPFGFLQKTNIIGDDIDDAYAIVRSSTPDAKYFTYASVVDRISGDPILILPPADPVPAGTDVYLAGAAHVEGTGGTDWRTDLEVHNPRPTPVSFEIALLEKDQSNLSPPTHTLVLDAGMSVRYEDVLLDVFGVIGAGAIRVTPANGSIMVSGRTFHQDSGRTYGQFIPGRVADDAIAFGQKGHLIQLSRSASNSSGYRTNIGFLNTTSSTIEVDVEIPAPGGELWEIQTSLLPYEYDQLDDAIGMVTSQSVDNLTARVTTTSPGGSLIAYASVVDNRSGDPTYIPATVRGEEIVAPATASVLSVAATTSSDVWLSWTAVSGATGYRLYRVGQSSPIYQGSIRSHTETGLDPDTVFCYSVLAYNDAGDGPMSAKRCASTTQPTEPGVWSSTGLEGHSAYSIAVCPADPAVVSVGTKGHGAFTSNDHGNSWQPRNDGLQETEVLETLYPSQDCGLLFAGTWHQETGNWRGGIYKSTDGGFNWTKKREANVISLAFDGTNPNTGFFGTQGRGVFRTTDSGETWAWAADGIGNPYVRALAVSRANHQEAFAGTERGVYKSTDAGSTWFEVGDFYLIDAVAVHPENPSVVYAARYRLYKSTDGGVSWEEHDWGSAGSIRSIVIDPQNPSTLYIGTSDGVYMSEDEGLTWSSLNDGLTDKRVGALAVGSGSPRFLFAGTHGDWDQIGDGDVFRVQLP